MPVGLMYHAGPYLTVTLSQRLKTIRTVDEGAESVTAPDMQIRVGTGSHRRRHSDVRCCAHGRRANRLFDPLPSCSTSSRSAARRPDGATCRICSAWRSEHTDAGFSLKIMNIMIQLKISSACTFSPNEPSFVLHAKYLGPGHALDSALRR
jgi:hypothetical protein